MLTRGRFQKHKIHTEIFLVLFKRYPEVDTIVPQWGTSENREQIIDTDTSFFHGVFVISHIGCYGVGISS